MIPTTVHTAVLREEVVSWLRPQPGAVLVDGTLGGGGHALALAERVAPGGRVIGVDRDPDAIGRTSHLVQDAPLEIHRASYTELPQLLDTLGLPVVDGILLDLGLSSDQLADPSRGFSFQHDGPLDLRFDPETGESAQALLSRLGERELADLIYQFGEERFSRKIARRIVEVRQTSPIETTAALAQIVRGCVPRSRASPIDPATRTFQALRIAVNGELDALEEALRVLPSRLALGGRLAIISFHSLEDRLVKHAFRNDPSLDVLTKRPLIPTEVEIGINPRARSAKLRVAQRCEPKPSESTQAFGPLRYG